MEETRSMMSSSSDAALLPIVKGKRTKRHRGTPPAAAPAPAGSSSTSSSEFSGTTTTTTTTEEEEDMANCLILLAQGGGGRADQEKPPEKQLTSRKYFNDDGKPGFYVYECKTCNKCFPSFQALGGHRASHKKPKLIPTTTTASPVMTVGDHEDNYNSMHSFNYKPVPVISSSRSRVHECSICGSEFSSGQALGGHMRRHRPLDVVPVPVPEMKRERANLLSLDLNLPAPSEDHSPAAINFPTPFATKQSLIAFSLSACSFG